MKLWRVWYQCVGELRPACRKLRTFLWMMMVMAALCTRSDLAGVTSFVRVLGLLPESYPCMLHLFRSKALSLDRLTEIWAQLAVRLFRPLVVGEYLICVADGIKAPKEGRLMPAVKKLHQASSSNSKPTYIMGHSLQAISVLVQGCAGSVAAIPIVSRIHEGLVWSNRDQRTLLDKLVALLAGVVKVWQRPVILVADAYYASRKVIEPLLARGDHLVTRCRINTVAYEQAAPPAKRRRGRPRLYGAKIRLRDLAANTAGYDTIASPVYGDSDVTLHYKCIDLLWRPVGHLVRFVVVVHPRRGTIFLMSTDTQMDPVDVIRLYGYRFKIELGFRHAVHVIGAYAYHFWMAEMTPLARNSGDQYMHMKSQRYRDQVKDKIGAYHLHVQLGCIAQGLMLHLSLNFSGEVWRQFRSWLRTMNVDQPPSELVVAHALRNRLPDFLDVLAIKPEAR
ncbi:MAG: transposase, partial [Candidatus Binatia bacterium]